MAGRLAIVVAQTNPVVGDLDNNLSEIVRILRENASADLVVFPECALTGYPLDDLVTRPGFLTDVAVRLDALAAEVQAIGGPHVIVGAPDRGADLPFNGAFLLAPHGGRRVAHKHDRPNDGPFDEVRTFALGDLRGPFAIKGVRVGVMICEEMWHQHVARHLAGELADLLVVINGSPYTRDKHAGLRLPHARRRALENGLPLIYANLVGGQDELVFDGASFAISAHGEVLMQAPAFQTCERALTFDGGRLIANSAESPIAAYPGTRIADYQACVLALRDYVDKSGFPGVVIGESGGIDSALVSAIAVDALGADRVLAVTMPSRITSGDNLSDAHAVAESLGIRIEEVPIAPMVAAFEAALAAAGDPGVAIENVQARVRMTVLMRYSNARGLLPVTTGNKSEVSVGYCTLYGDMAGGFNPIKDLYKTEVFDLARMRNRHAPEICLGPPTKVIPRQVIEKPPSAELAEGQTDEATLGPYVVLDSLLRSIVDDQIPAREAARVAQSRVGGELDETARDRFLTVEHAKFVGDLVRRSEHKRRQGAPGPKIGPRAFGRDRRYPIVSKHQF